ncbi:helix-turn-helix domain-containing protein (plasmid) [Novosphingobium sp. BL-8A]|uniref:helix-turn-helix domain-containing protein n=1 Tax=Novosphingobium sp. BL-8A TaxID=3127639 RepID=UPI003757A30D
MLDNGPLIMASKKADLKPRRSVQGPLGAWQRLAVNGIEEFAEAVAGANLETAQLARGRMIGSLAYLQDKGVTYSSGMVGRRLALRGCLSESMVTIGIGVRLGSGSRQWLNEVRTGEFAVFLPGASHDALYGDGSTYFCATLNTDHLEEIAAEMGLVLDRRQLGETGVSQHPLPVAVLKTATPLVGSLHGASLGNADDPSVVGRYLLRQTIKIMSRPPRHMTGRQSPAGHAKIVARAHDYILAHIDRPIVTETLCRSIGVSPSTLNRAFHEILCETPHSYVRKLRLNRIRNDIVSDAEAICTITIAANRWGISEMGRLSRWYRYLFDELPSGTIKNK